VTRYVARVVTNLFVEQCDFGFDVMHPAVLVLEEGIVDIQSARLLLAR